MTKKIEYPKSFIFLAIIHFFPALFMVFLFFVIMIGFLFGNTTPLYESLSDTLFFSFTTWFVIASIIWLTKGRMAYVVLILNIISWGLISLLWIFFNEYTGWRYDSEIVPFAAFLTGPVIAVLCFLSISKKVRSYFSAREDKPERKNTALFIALYISILSVPSGAILLTNAVAYSYTPASAVHITSSGDYKNYSRHNLSDEDLKTWWTPFNRDGRSAWVKYHFSEEEKIDAVEIHPGSHYPGHPKHGDLFKLNSRLEEAQLEFDDGTSQVIKLQDEDRLQVIEIKPKKTKSLLLRVRKTREGKKWNDLCVSRFKPLVKEKIFKEN